MLTVLLLIVLPLLYAIIAVSADWADCDGVLQCLDNLILTALPMKADKQSCNLEVHHYVANNGKWQENVRFKPLPSQTVGSITTVLYLGGNTKAADSFNLRKMLPNLQKMHILEPVPLFFDELSINMAMNYDWITLHNFGLGATTRDISMNINDLNGQGTFVMDVEIGTMKDISLKILSPSDFFNVHKFLTTSTMLHVNCEGCEYELFEALHRERFLSQFSVIQVSFHYFFGIKNAFSRYCRIHELLKDVYDYDPESISFGWERWVRKPIF